MNLYPFFVSAFQTLGRIPHRLLASYSGNKAAAGMLGIAVSLELIAFAAMFGLGGLSLGVAVLVLTALLLTVSVAVERRHVRQKRCRRHLWAFYIVNDRLGERGHGKRLIELGGSRQGLLATSWLCLDAPVATNRLRQSLGNN